MIKVARNKAIVALERSKQLYERKQRRLQEEYDLKTAASFDKVDLPPPDRTYQYELYRDMLIKHDERFVWLDHTDFQIIFRGEHL